MKTLDLPVEVERKNGSMRPFELHIDTEHQLGPDVLPVTACCTATGEIPCSCWPGDPKALTDPLPDTIGQACYSLQTSICECA